MVAHGAFESLAQAQVELRKTKGAMAALAHQTSAMVQGISLQGVMEEQELLASGMLASAANPQDVTEVLAHQLVTSMSEALAAEELPQHNAAQNNL